METAVWVRVIKHGRIVRQHTVSASRSEPVEPLNEALRIMDMPKPIWLEKNHREWDEFAQTRFIPADFVEAVDFDRIEVEYINPDAPKKRSQDPRNAV